MDDEPGARPEFGRGPGWPVRPPALTTEAAGSVWQTIRSRGARSWYVGAGISLFWLISVVQEIPQTATSTLSAVLGIVVVVVFAAAFLLGAPVAWALPLDRRLLVCGGLLALSFALFPWLGWGVVGTWTYVGVLVGISVLPWRATWALILGLGSVAALVSGLSEGWSENTFWLPAIMVSISLMMAAFARTTAAMNQLRATQAQLEVLAVARERTRFSRDLHDILGHSLTVITVKAELAGRLIDADPTRARIEIGEVEALARGALTDVRATVAGFRGVNVSGELAVARSALDAAGIRADLPSSTDDIAPGHRELAGWIVREGVTNVIRHSGARVCRITLRGRSVTIDDDGAGPHAASASSTGLLGLRERVESAGGQLTIGHSDLGGFRLRATM